MSPLSEIHTWRLKAQETPMFGLHFSMKSLLPSVMVELCSPQVHTSKQAPVLQNVTGFGDMVFKEVIKLRLLRWFLIQDDRYPYCCCCLVTKSCPSLCIPMDCNIPGFPVLHCLPKFAQSHIHWVGDAIKPSHSLLSPSPPAFNLSTALGSFPMSRLFPSSGQSIGASASASALLMNIQGWFPLGLTGLISFDLLAVQGALKSLLQHHSSKASILQHSAFYILQLSHLYNYW